MAADRFIVNVETFLVREGRYLLAVRSEQEAHAPGTLSPPGGVVDWIGPEQNVIEATAAREPLEEVGMRAIPPFVYVESHTFGDDSGARVVDVVLLARAGDGEPTARQPEEVAAVRWITIDEVAMDPAAQPWTRESLRRAEDRRLELGW